MAIVPLLEIPEDDADADAAVDAGARGGRPAYASHRVRSPGGYEWWHVEACDASADLVVRIDLFDGDPFNPAYRRAYARYRRRPTRVAPPVPGDFPNVRV